jgi:hypothetical protein
MKRVSWSAGLAVVLLCGCLEKGSRSATETPFLQLHWAGATAISTNGTNAAKLQLVLKLQSTMEVRTQAMAKLARVPQELWQKTLGRAAADASSRLQPLLEDLWQFESVVTLRGKPEQPDVLIAAKLDRAKADAWSKHLSQLAESWKLGSASVNGASAKWSVGRRDLHIHYARDGEWTFAAFTRSGKSPFSQGSAAITPLGGAILDMRADGRRLGATFPVLAKYSLPPSHLKVMPRGEALRTEGTLTYSERLPIKLEPWKIPTNLVTEPLVSFTCAQGIQPLLDQIKGYSKLRLKTPPNQFCSWGLGTVHAQTFLSVPLPNATNVLRDIADRLPQFVETYFTNPPGMFLWISNRVEWIWSGLPMVIPHVRARRSGNDEFLMAGLFPAPIGSNTAPAELFAQVIGRTNLVYYDWESTDQRLPHARQTFQLSDIIAGRRIQATNFATQRWISEVAPLLGNTVTEVTLSAPRELSLVRKSDIGLTGFEVAWLGRWIDSPRFPFHYEPPPMVRTRVPRPAAVTNQPVRGSPPKAETNRATVPKGPALQTTPDKQP